MTAQHEIAIIIPVYNEQENIKPLTAAIEKAMVGLDYEVLFIDDGSKDATVKEIELIENKRFKLVKFRRNYGQTPALVAGIDYANSRYIATIDGDLQNDPDDIPALLQKLKEENLDLVMGKRAKRKDGWILRKIPSFIANFIIRHMTGVKFEDYGCTLKVFTKELAESLELYGELHRFVPVLAHMNGARIAQVNVKHHARQFGVSKYGISRTFKVISDLMLMLYLLKFKQKPMHLFGTLGTGSIAISALIWVYMIMIKIFGGSVTNKPLFYIAITLLVTGVQLITTGFIAELLMRTYYQSQNKKPYNTKD